jgi:hypothetical protein
MEGAVNDEVTFKGKLSSGSSADPTSTNQTFEKEFNKKAIWIDQVYLTYAPSEMQGWKFFAGKFGPNWVNSLLTIDSDVNVEGIGQSYSNADGLVVNLAELVPDEKGFYLVGQIGKKDLLTKGLEAYVTYHFINDGAWQFITKKLKDGDLTNHMQLDRIDASDYQAIDVIGKYTFDTGGMPIAIEGDYVLNLASDATEGLSGLRQGAWAKVGINKAKDLGDTEGSIEWGRLQANSVMSFLTDADRGSGDSEWYGGAILYKWLKNLDIGLTYIHSKRLSKDSDYDLFQLDFLGKV